MQTDLPRKLVESIMAYPLGQTIECSDAEVVDGTVALNPLLGS